ncbi:MAG: phosphoribosyltransferase, partial [Flavobacteriales bacterium]|nr:phosphoribosyltransferase [Flavobacteriales bacterium]
YYPKKAELYSRYGVTPFVQLDFINNYDAIEIQKRVNNVFKLSNVVKELLIKNNCYHPFTSNSLSTIISEELYLNFLDHSLESAFNGFHSFASLSISFRDKLKDELKYLNETNFKSEQIQEAKSFFFDSKNKEYLNRAYIEFSFLDFGTGIPNTLKKELSNSNDSEILKFAFCHNSSRHPIYVLNDKPEEFIPRGLFDVLTIVKRYKGLLVVRSNYGKILYDFSKSNNVEEVFKTFGDEKHFFPGTLISLYIPTLENIKSLNESSIKPEFSFQYIIPNNKFYLNINDVLKNVNSTKETIYSDCLRALRKAILKNSKEPSIVYLSFLGYNVEDRISRKLLIYLMTDYDINIKTNIVLIHGPKEDVIIDVANILNSLSSVYKKYKLHPLPIIKYLKAGDDISIKWLGVYDEADIKKLDDLLYSEFSLAKSDFNDPNNLEGHIISYDAYGTLISHLPDRGELISIFKDEEDIIISNNLRDLLEGKEGIVNDNDKDLYLCNGNYYQKEYIEINNIINSKEELENISALFYKKLESKISNITDLQFIGITSTSNKILQSFVDLKLIPDNQFWAFQNYHSFVSEMNKKNVDSNIDFILICDVISTGFLTSKLDEKLKELKSYLKYVGVLVSVIDENFRIDNNHVEGISSKLISLYDYPIRKYEVSQLKDELIGKNIIRINPFTNIPIRLSFEETNYNDSIIFHSIIEYSKEENQIIFKNELLDSILSEQLKIGYYKFNNVIHPYFFDTKAILENLPIDLLKKTFAKIKNEKLRTDKISIFYPRDSGIKSDLFFTNLKTAIGNDNIEEIEIDRINSKEGWRFPHNSKYLSSKVDGNLCLIIDDGTSTGDSLMQMIDEISFYNAKEIILLCFIGRVPDHKREFFSRISSVNVKNGAVVNLSIFFATHWHIPTYYLDSNPVIDETNWLKELINIPNTPYNISKISKRISKAIEPRKDNFKDYRYLPKIKGTVDVPKKDLIIRREEIGKVIGYRLYKESFNYFNYFIKKYSQQTREAERYKEIELICACFVYEPYLYEKLTNILPDVTLLIEEFVKFLIYSFNKYEKHGTYDWDKKDIIHLFFIVFRDEKLLKELNPENFKKLIEFTKPKESSLDYVLYKLLKYFPLNNQFQDNYKYDLEFKRLIKQLIQTESSNVDVLRNYLSFLNTLPSKENFESQLYNLQSHYEKDDAEDLHTNKKQLDHNVSAISSLIDKIISFIENDSKIILEDIQKLKYIWLELSSFVTPILSFTSSFPNFIIPSPRLQLYNRIEGKDIESVRSRMGFNSNTILSIDSDFKDINVLKQLDENIKIIQIAIDKNSDFYKIVFNNKSNLKDLIELMKNEFEKQMVPFELEFNDSFVFTVPLLYSENLICKELVANYQNHSFNDSGIKCEINFDKNEDCYTIILKNKIKPKVISNSSREGLRCLKELSKSDIFGFNYNSDTITDEFVQILKFKKPKNGY